MENERNTLIPFWQFVKWLGLDGWRVAGVSRGQPSPSTYGTPVKHNDNCECLLEYEEKHVTRLELLQSLYRAEEFFIKETGRFPAPKQIEDETHRVNNGWRIDKSKPSHYSNLKSFRPFYPCGVQKFGYYKLHYETNATVNKTNGEDDTPLDIMSIVFDVPEETDLQDIRLFFTNDECVYCGSVTQMSKETWDYNFHLCEIRPFCDIVEGSSEVDGMKQITITLHSYILVKPSLQSEAELCLPHEVDTYVDSLNVYIEDKEPCEDGHFECYESGCGSVPCSSENMGLCVMDRIVYKEKWFVPKPLDCTVNDLGECECIEVCPPCNPDRVIINYITGCELNIDKTVPFSCFETIAKLAIALQECEKSWCECDVCISKRIAMYSKVPKELVREGNEIQGFGDEFQILVDKIALMYVDGLVPTRGMIEAMRDIIKRRCINRSGSYNG